MSAVGDRRRGSKTAQAGMESPSLVVAVPARHRALCRRAFAGTAAIALRAEGRWLDALRLVARHRPQVVVIGTPGGLPSRATISALRRQSSGTRIIVLVAGAPSDASSLEAARRGAHGCLGASTNPALIRKAVASVARGEAWFPRRIAPAIVRYVLRTDPHTDRAHSCRGARPALLRGRRGGSCRGEQRERPRRSTRRGLVRGAGVIRASWAGRSSG